MAWIWSGQPCLVVYKMRKNNSDGKVMLGYMRPSPLSRIEIYFPLISEEDRRDTILHECAHLAYRDARVSGMTEAEAMEMVSEIEPETLALYPPHQQGEESVIRLVDMRRGGLRIYGVSRPLARAVGRLSRPRPVRAALWASAPVVMCAAPLLAGSPAAALTFETPTGSPLSQPHQREHVYELNGTCLRAVPKGIGMPQVIEVPDMAALPGRSEWSVSSVSCATYHALHDAGAWGTGVYQTAPDATPIGLVYYPWNPY
ncbi:hypothetical protein [Paenirhodobacter populi]|uniref:hypothetical protein n=1 Tax=Paenirhodobacter populi TaxID=2306993 RepID=UPI000FE3F9EC|nr:hypothetical protein [Sinirhodobacter populi]RWR05001.1 hypothetical protein D2T32_18190 [Sinirhodobacter populi]